MSRRLYLALLLSQFALSAAADPVDDLVAEALKGDRAGVARLLAQATSSDELRDMNWAIAASHPDLRAFTAAWAATEPDNPAALVARAWSLYHEGFLLRGEAGLDHTWPASLDAANARFDDAFLLAETALALDPGYLPASDAVIVIGQVSGDKASARADGARIMALSPNRHSLVLSATLDRPNWGGTEKNVRDMCDAHAASVTDVPGYTADMCVIEAVQTGAIYGELRGWALANLANYVDHPAMFETLEAFAKTHEMPLETADAFRARANAKGRMTVDIALSGRVHLLSYPKLPDMPDEIDFPALRMALDRDLAKARRQADHHPANPAVLRDLASLYFVSVQLAMREAGFCDVPPPADIEARYTAIAELEEANAADLSARAMVAVKATPRNVRVLQFGMAAIQDARPDPLEAAIWHHSLGTNAILYSNYRIDIIADFLQQTRYERGILEDQIAAGAAPAYTSAQLDAAFDCPFLRALRLFEATCDRDGMGLDDCYASRGLSPESDYAPQDSILAQAEARGLCVAEREDPVASLWYKEIDLGL
ncbi:MAG: hypothetical protein MUE52_13455 [Tabrizicola sp.]|jgi:hypothetical protein|nr:hypothetical protein [Tabrizicola sp.]